MARSRHELIEQFIDAMNVLHWDQLKSCIHPDYEEFYPQSGERIRGRDRAEAIVRNYPGGNIQFKPEQVIGAEDRFVVTPSMSVLRIEGTGDIWTVVTKAHYPDGSAWYVISILEFRDDLIYRNTGFFAQPFEPPEWRREWVDVEERPAAGS